MSFHIWGPLKVHIFYVALIKAVERCSHLSIEVAAVSVRVVAVDQDVDALEDPADAHDDVQLREQDGLKSIKLPLGETFKLLWRLSFP